MSIISLNRQQSITIPIDSKDLYSHQTILVKSGEEYLLTCKPNQKWRDWFIKTSPTGYFNPLASLAGLRLKGEKCFCLCGVYNKNDTLAFAIGIGRTVIVEMDGELSFFANDSKGFYWNNSGTIQIQVRRNA